MNKLTAEQKVGCLQFNPFQDDFGDQGDRIFSDRICIARSAAPCHYCLQPINRGEGQRRLVGRYNGVMLAYRWCSLCCAAMASSWTDGGAAIDARFALRRCIA